MNETLYRIALTMVPNIGPVLSKKSDRLLRQCRSCIQREKSALSKIPGIGTLKAREINASVVLPRAEEELRFVEQNQVQVLFFWMTIIRAG